MKIQCNGCEKAEATVLCCADEAALCWDCDEKVHAANKLASKHQRVTLSNSSSPMSKCDICQETVGYFFCLEDRALLCRKCDIAIHTANSYVSRHQRFLLTGVKVGLESAQEHPCVSSSSTINKSSIQKLSGTVSSSSQSISSTGMFLDQIDGVVTNKVPFAGGGSFSGSTHQEWHLNDYIGLTNFIM